jgi:hypothetical protein
MQTQFTIKFNGKTWFYPTLELAEKMAKFVGFPIANIQIVDIW